MLKLNNTYAVVQPNNPIAGDVYFDTKAGNAFLYDGKDWVMTFDSKSSQRSITELCIKYPGLLDLKKQLDEAQAKFDAFLALIEEHKNVNR